MKNTATVPPSFRYRFGRLGCILIFLLAAMTSPAALTPLGTGFTYQGRLNDGAAGASGRYDLTFALHDAASGGAPILTVTNVNVDVANGLFATPVNFGSGIFTGYALWMEIGVRSNGTAAAFATLSPRQPITPTPNAHYATLAGTVPGGAITSSKLGVDSVTTSALQNNAVTGAKIADGTIAPADLNIATFGATFWKADGNAGTTPGANFLGTTDNQPLALRVNGTTALRIDPTATLPNIVGGLAGVRPTVIGTDVRGAVVAGGAAPAGPVNGFGGGDFHAVYDSDGTIGGGFGNKIGTDNNDPNDSPFGTVAGGVFNSAVGYAATVAGGDANFASGARSSISGGYGNQATGADSAVGGGFGNVAGGQASFAAGQRAKANHDGSFVWADLQPDDFASTANNQFSVRASGGVRFSANTPWLTFDGASSSILFPPSPGANAPMIYMFGGGTANTPRMVLAHSPSFPNWGLQYEDSSDKFHFLNAGVSMMTIDLGRRAVGIGTTAPAVQLDVFAGQAVGRFSSTNNGNGAVLVLRNTTASPTYLGAINFEDADGTSGQIGYFADDHLGFRVNGAEQMSLDSAGNLAYGGQLNKLDVAANFVATVRAADFTLGHSSRRGSPGRALVDFTDTLYLNFASDWAHTFIGGDNVSVCSLTVRGGCDIAEPFQMSQSETAIPKGAVVVIDEDNPGHLKMSDRACDRRVAGIISGANGVNTGVKLTQEGVFENGQDVALSGRVYVQAEAGNGSIVPGDLLTTSEVPGHAMKVTDHAKAQGAILGKAMTGLKEGKGMVLVLVTLQ